MYSPIENYGVIGDLHTVALVGSNGSIDWLCYPRFDSPSVFGAVLDDKKGGRFIIGPDAGNVTCRQLYLPDTNILITRFMTEEGVSEVMDFMPLGPSDENYHGRVIRIAKVVRGTMSLKLECTPAFDYGRADHTVEIRGNRAVFHSEKLGCMLKVSQSGHQNIVAIRADGNGGVVASGTLRGEQRAGGCVPGRRRARHRLRLPGGGRLSRAAGADRKLLASVAPAVPLQRPLARAGGPLGADAEAPVLRAHRGHRGRAHLQPPGRHRRDPQLGLPLHLDP